MAQAEKKDWSKFLGIKESQDEFKHLHWEGTFWEYLDMVKKDPRVARNAFQRCYDMVMDYGTDSYTEYKKKITRYKFFEDPIENGKDAVLDSIFP